MASLAIKAGSQGMGSHSLRPSWRQDAGVSRIAARKAASQARRTLASPRLTQAKTGRMPVFRV
jgi:hypothetical protein